MSLRLRLLLMIGISLLVLWGVVAIWMFRGLEEEMQRTLDQRLAMSAQMVAGLMSQNPAAWNAESRKGVSTMTLPGAAKGLACQVSLRGEVIARTPSDDEVPLGEKAPGFSEREINGVAWRSYTLDAHGLRVTTADRLVERSVFLRNVAVAAAVPFFVALIGSLIVLWFGVNSGLRPLEQLRRALANRAPDTSAPVEAVAVPHELQPLVETINALIARMSDTLARERRFTSDAAHELRTPLTAIKTHLQVARITRGEDSEVALDYAEEGVARLQRTLTQLLTLAKVESSVSWENNAVANSAEVARLAMRDANPMGDEGRILLEGDDICVPMALPEALAVTAVRNLLDNALRHGAAGVPVKLQLRATPGGISFIILDHGPGLNPDHFALASQRFWRRGPGLGSGLGLSIVTAIAQRFGGSFVLTSHSAGGLEAKLTFPVIESPCVNT